MAPNKHNTNHVPTQPHMSSGGHLGTPAEDCDNCMYLISVHYDNKRCQWKVHIMVDYGAVISNFPSQLSSYQSSE